MKKSIILTAFTLLFAQWATAQLKTGSDGIYVTGHTALSVDGLVIVPTNWVHLSSTSIEMSSTPLPGSPGSIKRVYSITPALPIDGLTTIGLYYKPAELNGNNAFTLQMVYSETNGTPYTVTSGSISEPADNFVYKNITTAHALGKITAMQANGALPVRLAVFTVEKEGRNAVLNWETVSETNSDVFQIEKSLDAKSWTQTGIVKSAGTTAERQFYSFTDTNPLPSGEKSTVYYRLKQMDSDGSYAYSQIRNVIFDGSPGDASTGIYVYPNPVADRLFFSGSSGMKSVQIISQDGQVLKDFSGSQLDDVYTNGLDVRTLQTGGYFIKTSLLSGQSQNLKIVKK